MSVFKAGPGFVLAMGLLGATAAGAEEFNVSFSALGKARAEEGAAAGRFVEKLDARPGIDAGMLPPAPASGSAWHTSVPEGLDPTRWIHLVLVEFSSRQDWLAFTFDPASGAVATATRRPATSLDPPAGTYLHSIAPGPGQVPHNAVAELAEETAHRLDSRFPPPGGKLLSLELRTDPGREDQPLPAILPSEAAGFTALAYAAAHEAGWSATPHPVEENRLLLTLKRGVGSFSVEAERHEAGERTVRTRRDIPAEEIYNGLVNLFHSFEYREGDVSDEIQLAPAGFTLVGYHQRRLFLSDAGRVWAVSTDDGGRVWRIPKPERQTPRFTARTEGGGRFRLFRYAPSLAEIDPAAGTLRTLAGKHGASTPWGFQFHPPFPSPEKNAPADWAVASDRTLFAGGEGREAWSFEAGDRLGCGPAISEAGQVFVGGDNGEMTCLALNDGSRIWHRVLPGRLRGPITLAGDTVIAGTVEGDLYALDRETGRVAWRFSLGDIPLGPGIVQDASRVVAGKNNRICRLEAATGRLLAEYRTKTWITGMTALGESGRIVCADREGSVVFLDGKDLAPRKTIDLKTRPRPGLIYARKVPLQWRTAGQFDHDFVPSGPAVLLGDERGMVYILPAAE